jgi:hypothetical protein
MSEQEPKPGQELVHWIASGFTRRCVVIRVDRQDGMALVRYPEYDLQNEWVKWDNLS